MKAKRQAYPSKAASHNVILMIVTAVLPILILVLGAIYAVESRFTLPMAIVFFWICGAMLLWHFGKRRF